MFFFFALSIIINSLMAFSLYDFWNRSSAMISSSVHVGPVASVAPGSRASRQKELACNPLYHGTST
jgi:hypothetical protein